MKIHFHGNRSCQKFILIAYNLGNWKLNIFYKIKKKKSQSLTHFPQNGTVGINELEVKSYNFTFQQQIMLNNEEQKRDPNIVVSF